MTVKYKLNRPCDRQMPSLWRIFHGETLLAVTTRNTTARSVKKGLDLGCGFGFSETPEFFVASGPVPLSKVNAE